MITTKIYKFGSICFVYCRKTDRVGEPATYLEAVSCDDFALWLIAMNEEIESLHHNETWVLVKPLSEKTIIKCKWILKKK